MESENRSEPERNSSKEQGVWKHFLEICSLHGMDKLYEDIAADVKKSFRLVYSSTYVWKETERDGEDVNKKVWYGWNVSHTDA